MTKRTKTELDTQVDSLFADNVTGEITPFHLRTHLKDMQDSMTNSIAGTSGTIPVIDTDSFTLSDSALTETTDNIVSSKPVKASNLHEVGFADYNDLGTQSAPITLTAGIEAKLTNDAAGSNTSDRLPDGVDPVWNELTDQFDWTSLDIGDTVDIRVDTWLTTNTNNQLFSILMYLGVGAGEFSIPILSDRYLRDAREYRVVEYMSFYIGSNLTKDNPAELRCVLSGAGSIKVNGWYVRVNKGQA